MWITEWHKSDHIQEDEDKLDERKLKSASFMKTLNALGQFTFATSFNYCFLIYAGERMLLLPLMKQSLFVIAALR